ncbi:hypothetical protein DICPUDRAFT_152951 [Dictyostelium purpureum]|uniref:RING-type domain-containing protein n=1 Tax=Dictyostelium purpureum TaxID=5786 RepID=F0ZMP4_DICPU|nr:uncharacterized protein DICPUDRAFT_152951 [Dictyostelium purpureum]EGC34779.1 hypothetical protein DICPUDRAFT_152951 [Dictyostelium purpureum]|eukprot:XP_003288694.1 hypothetical protein DICPUDRAFT_152951 [Dictyostelium purpureum]
MFYSESTKINNSVDDSIYYRYIDSIDEDYNCLICFHPCENPVIEPNCQQMYCRECLIKSLEKSKNVCPFCNTETSVSSLMLPPKFITNFLNELKVVCTICYKENSSVLNRKDFQNHLQNDCRAKCKGPCGQEIPYKDLNSHICPFVDLSYLTIGNNKVLSKSGKWLNTTQIINYLKQISNQEFKETKINEIILKASETMNYYNYKDKEVYLFRGNYDLDEIPSNYSSIGFVGGGNRSMFYLASHLDPYTKELFLLDDFDQRVYPEEIPKHIETLHIYNVKYQLEPSCIPSTVKSVHFHDGYKFPFDQGVIPEGIEEVHIHNVIHPITKSSLPSTIKKISFNNGYSHAIRPGTLSKNIESIHIGDIKEPLIPESIPFKSKTQRKLYIHGGYKHSLRPGVIPKVDSLFICDIKKPISNDSLPNSIQHLYFSEDFSHFIHSNILTHLKNMKSLVIPNLDYINVTDLSNLELNENLVLYFNSNSLKQQTTNFKTSIILKPTLKNHFSSQ